MNTIINTKIDNLINDWTEGDVSNILSALYYEFDMNLFFEEDNWFLSFTNQPSKDILVKFAKDGEFNTNLVFDYISAFDNLKQTYSNLKNIFVFSKAAPSFDLQKELSVFGIKFCDLNYIKDLYSKATKNLTHIELLAHNYIALQNILNYSESKNKIGVVRATGTGKSFLIASLISMNVGKKMLLLSPSNLILDQLRKYFGDDFFKSIDCITYNKLSKESSSETLATRYDYIYLDEYHRCGASVWEQFVRELINSNPKSKIIGFTATDKRHLDGNRDMTEELFDGNICSELPLCDAIASDILKAPYYVSALYDIEEDLSKLERRILNGSKDRRESLLSQLNEFKINWNENLSISHIFKKHLDVTKNYKFIVFCKDTAHSREMDGLLKEWFIKAGFKSVITNELNYSTINRDEVIDAFENTSLSNGTVSLLLTVSIFNEGYHSKNCNNVIFLRKTQSNIIFSQQLGRALSSSNSDTPIVFDLTNNFRNVKRLSLVKDLNNSISNQDLRRKRFGLKEHNYVCDIYDEVQDPLSIFQSIEQKVSFSWYDWLEEYKLFVMENNTPVVRKSYSNKGLYGWVVDTRTAYRRQLLTESQINELNKLGFVFDVLEEQWVESFNSWVSFKNDTGREPSTTSESKYEISLAKWCFQQRRLKKAGKIKEHRRNILEDAGFKWSLRNQDWETNIKLMASQIKERGSSLMTTADVKTNPLYYWHSRIISEYLDGNLDRDKELELISIGFDFEEVLSKKNISISSNSENSLSSSDILFEKRLKQYRDYVQEFSRFNVRDSDVKANPIKYKGLYSWYKAVRRKDSKKKQLTEAQHKILEKAGVFNK